MDFGSFASRAGKLVADNSPAILTAIGVTGVIFTAVLTGKATFRAAEILQEEKDRNKDFLAGIPKDELRLYEKRLNQLVRRGASDAELEKETGLEKEEAEKLLVALGIVPGLDDRAKIGLIWKEYTPAVVTGAITIAAIFGANHIGTRRAAALASAYSLSEKAISEYKEKVLKKVGKNKEQAIRDEIAQDQVNRNPVGIRQIVGGLVPGNDLCYDARTDRFFYSDVQSIRSAVNDINQQIMNANDASLTDFYNLIGLKRTNESDELGWNSNECLDVSYTYTEADGHPCLSIAFNTWPIRNYWRQG